MTIAESLRRFRRQYGKTQEQMASVIGTSKQAYYAYERVDKPSIPSAEIIKKFATAFNVPADYLLGITDDPNGNIDTADTIKISAKDFNSIAMAAKAFADAFLDISTRQVSTEDSEK